MMKKLLHSIAALMIAATTISPAQAASITTPPSSQNVSLGQPVSLSVVATGTGTINYQWQKDGVAIPAATPPASRQDSKTWNGKRMHGGMHEAKPHRKPG